MRLTALGSEKESSARDAGRRFIDTDYASTVWSLTSQPAPTTPRLTDKIDAEVVIVGAGFSGLATALFLAERGISSVVLEAGEIAQGASGLNSGHCTPTFAHRSLAEVYRIHGSEADALISRQCASGELVHELIARYDIECDLVTKGLVQAAHSASALSVLRERAADYASRGHDTHVLSASDIKKLTGGQGYYGGWLNTAASHLNPVSYATGLAKAVIKLGGAIFTHSPAIQVKHALGQWHVTTPDGEVRADKCVMATGAYSKLMWPQVQSTFVTMKVMGLASRPVGAEIRAEILPQNHHFTDTAAPFRILTFDASDRLVTAIPCGIAFGLSKSQIQDFARTYLSAKFPALSRIEWTRTWIGRVDLEPQHEPSIMKFGPEGYAVAGFSGRGIPTCTSLGEELSHILAGSRTPQAAPLRDLRPLPTTSRLKLTGVLAAMTALNMGRHMTFRIRSPAHANN